MILENLIEKYKPKSVIEMLLYMRRNYCPKKYFTIKELAENLNKTEGSISRDIKKLELDNLITKKYFIINYRSGNRLQIFLSENGLKLSTFLLLRWLGDSEKALIKNFNSLT